MSPQLFRNTLLCLFLLLSACGGSSGSSGSSETTDSSDQFVYEYSVPSSADDGWQVAHLDDVGISEPVVTRIVQDIHDGDFPRIDSIAIVKDGFLVLDHRFRTELDKVDRDIGNTDLDLHSMQSTTKSVASALIGIAIEQGHIAGVDVRTIDLFPDRTIRNLDARKEAVTLEDILTMRAGMEWSEWGHPYTDCQNDYIDVLFCQAAPIQHVLDLPMVETPGTVWNYNGGTSHLLSELLSAFSGTDDILDFAREFLFEPMGITDFDWEYDSTGILRQGGSGLWLTPRDMAKFGYLYLNNGVWEDEQIVPAAFVAESVRTRSPPFGDPSLGYGYQSWWTYPQEGVYFAAGANGQIIFVVPALDLVAVLTAYLPAETGEVKKDMLFDYIIASCDP